MSTQDMETFKALSQIAERHLIEDKRKTHYKKFLVSWYNSNGCEELDEFSDRCDALGFASIMNGILVSL